MARESGGACTCVRFQAHGTCAHVTRPPVVPGSYRGKPEDWAPPPAARVYGDG